MHSENKDNITIKVTTGTGTSTSTTTSSSSSGGKCPMTQSTEKAMSQMHLGSLQHSKQIPTEDLAGIERFDEAMQIYFRDAYNLCKIFAVTMALKMQIFEIINSSSSSGSGSTNKDSSNGLTLQEIFAKLPVGKVSGFSERHLRDLLCELGAQGYLQTEGGLDSHVFRLTDLTRNSFLISSANSISRMYMNLSKYMNCFSEASLSNFAFGTKPLNHSTDSFKNESEVGMTMDYFYKTAQPSFERMLELIDFSRFKSILDVRGSYGLLGAMLKRKFPALTVTSFDNPSLQTFAAEKISQLGMQNEVLLQAGSLLTGQLPQADCVLAPFVFMHYNDENCVKIMKHVLSCMSESKNGQLVILENLMDTDRKDCKALSMSFMIGIQNCEGNARTFNEFMVMLMSAGFKTVDRMHMGPGMADMMIAMK